MNTNFSFGNQLRREIIGPHIAWLKELIDDPKTEEEVSAASIKKLASYLNNSPRKALSSPGSSSDSSSIDSCSSQASSESERVFTRSPSPIQSYCLEQSDSLDSKIGRESGDVDQATAKSFTSEFKIFEWNPVTENDVRLQINGFLDEKFKQAASSKSKKRKATQEAKSHEDTKRPKTDENNEDWICVSPLNLQHFVSVIYSLFHSSVSFRKTKTAEPPRKTPREMQRVN